MKVLYFSFSDVSGTKGPNVNEREFILSLYNLLGDNTNFIIPKPAQSIPSELPIKNITFISGSKKNRALEWFNQQKELTRTFSKVLKENNIDLIIFRKGLFDVALLNVLKKNKHIPYVLRHAGAGQFSFFKEKALIYRILAPLHKRIFKKLVQNSALATVVSPMEKELLIKATVVNSSKIKFIDNGVNINRFYIKDKKETRQKLKLNRFKYIIGYAGNLSWERGGMQIVKALPKLIKQYPKMGAVILGDGDKMNLLYDEAKRLNVTDHIVFTGRVSYNTVVDYMNSFDVAVSQRYESSQYMSELKVRQYLACGVPTIVSPSSTNNFVEEKGFGYIVNPNDIDNFIDKTVKILDIQGNILDKKRQEIRDYAVNYLSYDSKVKEYIKCFEQIIASNNK